jgi:hypothetical protein
MKLEVIEALRLKQITLETFTVIDGQTLEKKELVAVFKGKDGKPIATKTFSPTNYTRRNKWVSEICDKLLE